MDIEVPRCKIKEMTKWFKAKKYGWGWYPATWQGWAITIGYLLIVLNNAARIDARAQSASDGLINFLPETVVVTILLIIICYKTGEKPRWRWGR